MRIAVFCGSNTGNDLRFSDTARSLGIQLYNNHIELVYGGGNIGLMGILADSCLQSGGTVTGVIPQKLVDIEVAHTSLTHLHIVKDMHTRKALMNELSDAFIVMPGGIGTLEEFFEVFTWLQLGYHHKPVGILNTAGFYERLIDFMNHLMQEGFMLREHFNRLIIEENPESLIRILLNQIR